MRTPWLAAGLTGIAFHHPACVRKKEGQCHFCSCSCQHVGGVPEKDAPLRACCLVDVLRKCPGSGKSGREGGRGGEA